MKRWTAALAVAVTLAAASPALALSVRSREVLVSGYPSLYPTRVTALSSGAYVAAWYDRALDAEVGRARARIYQPNGEATQDLLCSAADNSTAPAVVGLANDTFMLGCDEHFDLPWTRPRLQRFDATGTPLGEPFFVNARLAAQLKDLYPGAGGTAIVSGVRCGNSDCVNVNDIRGRSGRSVGTFQALKFESVLPVRDRTLLQIGAYDDPVGWLTLVARRRTADGRRTEPDIKLAERIGYPGPAARGHRGIIAASWPKRSHVLGVQLFNRDGTLRGRRRTIRLGGRSNAIHSATVVPIARGLLVIWSASKDETPRLLAQRATRQGKLLGEPVEIDDGYHSIDSVAYLSHDASVVFGTSTDRFPLPGSESIVVRLNTTAE